jgi:hypothetical protein
MFGVILTEFKRARAAARRYDDLRYRSACQEGIAAARLPRRIFEEFYKGSDDAAAVPHRNAELLIARADEAARREARTILACGEPAQSRAGMVALMR